MWWRVFGRGECLGRVGGGGAVLSIISVFCVGEWVEYDMLAVMVPLV